MMMMMNDDKGENTSYLLVMEYFGLIIFLPRNLVRGTSGSFTKYTYTALSLCQLQGRTCLKMHAGAFSRSANRQYHLS